MKFSVFIAVLVYCVSGTVNQTCMQQTNQTFGLATTKNSYTHSSNNYNNIAESNCTSIFKVSKFKICTSVAGQITGLHMQLNNWNGTNFGNDPIALAPIGDVTNKLQC